MKANWGSVEDFLKRHGFKHINDRCRDPSAWLRRETIYPIHLAAKHGDLKILLLGAEGGGFYPQKVTKGPVEGSKRPSFCDILGFVLFPEKRCFWPQFLLQSSWSQGTSFWLRKRYSWFFLSSHSMKSCKTTGGSGFAFQQVWWAVFFFSPWCGVQGIKSMLPRIWIWWWDFVQTPTRLSNLLSLSWWPHGMPKYFLQNLYYFYSFLLKLQTTKLQIPINFIPLAFKSSSRCKKTPTLTL